MRLFDPDDSDDAPTPKIHRPKATAKPRTPKPPPPEQAPPAAQALTDMDEDGDIITDCDEITALRWVAANIDATVKKSQAPSKGSWALLKSVRTDDKIREKFWDKYMALAAKQDDKSNDTLGQTGRFTVALLDEMIAYCKPGAQDEDEVASEIL